MFFFFLYLYRNSFYNVQFWFYIPTIPCFITGNTVFHREQHRICSACFHLLTYVRRYFCIRKNIFLQQWKHFLTYVRNGEHAEELRWTRWRVAVNILESQGKHGVHLNKNLTIINILQNMSYLCNLIYMVNMNLWIHRVLHTFWQTR